MLHDNIKKKIINAFYKVNNTLGNGFLEKVYENAMAIELRKLGCKVLQQENIKIYYETEEVGDYFADLLVDDLVIVALKAAESLCEEHEAQLINYLKATKNRNQLINEFRKESRIQKKNIFQ